jgi:hypothetical protein
VILVIYIVNPEILNRECKFQITERQKPNRNRDGDRSESIVDPADEKCMTSPHRWNSLGTSSVETAVALIRLPWPTITALRLAAARARAALVARAPYHRRNRTRSLIAARVRVHTVLGLVIAR